MRVLVAPDSFKGGATAHAVADAMAEGVLSALPDARIDRCPLADGGEGTLEVLVDALGGRRHRVTVTGADGAPVEAEWAMLDDGRAVVEMASAAGLARSGPGRPGSRTTRGVGELISRALDAGASRVLVGLGGSATVDAGLGAARALGLPVDPDLGHGEDLTGLRSIGRLRLPLDLLCDVRTTLMRAPALFGPQKGATPEQVALLERGVAHLIALAEPDCPRAGAAGGLAYGLMLCGGTLHDGIDLVLEAVGFSARAARADWILVGEGRLDAQTAEGKVITGVLRHGRPTWALVGSAQPGVQLPGLSGFNVVTPAGMPLASALRRTSELVAEAARRWALVASRR